VAVVSVATATAVSVVIAMAVASVASAVRAVLGKTLKQRRRTRSKNNG
jgi:NADH:ubiquinone oxidoreductase subunit 3 (subunit A)